MTKRCGGLVRSLVVPGFELMSHSAFSAFESNITVKRDLENVDIDTVVIDSEDALQHASDENCPICLMKHSNPITLTTCCHSFCELCITQWLKLRTVCPLCKGEATYFLKGKYQETLKLYEIQDGELHGDNYDDNLLKAIKLHRLISSDAQMSAGSKRKLDCLVDFSKSESKEEDQGITNGHEQSTTDNFNPQDFCDDDYRIDGTSSSSVFTGEVISLQTEGSYLEFQLFREHSIMIFDIQHVFVPKKHRKKSVAEGLVMKAVRIARQMEAFIRPTCSYVRNTFVTKHKELVEFFENSLEKK
jgi:predicted GNAT family acetyltransferase